MSDFTFNDILERRGVDQSKSRIVRHDIRALKAWRHSRAKLEHFISYQRTGGRTPYRAATFAFQFVPVQTSHALFVGAYRILDEWVFPEETRQPILHDPIFGENDHEEHMRYDLQRMENFEDLVGKLLIEWGGSTRAWSQWTARREKPIIEIRAHQEAEPFPGFSRFHSQIHELEFLPSSWQGALASVGGVYLLVCADTGEQYVGSAYGEGGFLNRWKAYAANGHGGNRLLMGRESASYAVSILEIASPDMSASDIIHRETAWKIKLGSRAHGLNAN